MTESELLNGFIGGFFTCLSVMLIILAVYVLPNKETLKHKYEQFPKRVKR